MGTVAVLSIFLTIDWHDRPLTNRLTEQTKVALFISVNIDRVLIKSGTSST